VAAVLGALRESGMAERTIIVFAADHGELGGNHQMRGKGNCAYWQQNHVPLMIVHPAYPGGTVCHAVTSHIDLAPTLLALTGAKPSDLALAGSDLKGHDLSGLLKAPMAAGLHAIRPAALFNYNMLTFQDAVWTERMVYFMDSHTVPTPEKIQSALQHEPDFHDRCGIRSVFDGRYRFSRYFAPLRFNTPTSLDTLFADNDVELYDLSTDAEETHNLAMDRARNGDLIMAMNALLNARIAEEVGVDDGAFLPIRDGKWYFPPASKR
jgi:arylsulfatase A-like enzyme